MRATCPPKHLCLGCRDDQLLAGLDLVGVLQLVRLRDLFVLIGIAVELLADLREIGHPLFELCPTPAGTFVSTVQIDQAQDLLLSQ